MYKRHELFIFPKNNRDYNNKTEWGIHK